MSTVIYFDFETGGLKPEHPNIQIAAVAVLNGEEVDSFERKLEFNPAVCDRKALELNSYDVDVWAREAVPQKAGCNAFLGFLRKHADTTLTSARTGRPYDVALIGGHNVAAFDIPRLRDWAGPLFIPACWWYPLDTYQRAIWWFHERGERPSDFKLATLAQHFGIDHSGAHDAFEDVRMCAALAQRLVQ